MDEMMAWLQSQLGKPYIWGGESPLLGWDCSGLVQSALRIAGEDPPGDQTAQGLCDYFSKKGEVGRYVRGALAFYGKDVTRISHVGILTSPYLMIEAGGGDSHCTTPDIARIKNAFVRYSLVKQRADLICVIRPFYTKIGLIYSQK